MSFTVRNKSNNPLRLSDGKFLAPKQSRVLETVTEQDKKLADKGWLSIIEGEHQKEAEAGTAQEIKPPVKPTAAVEAETGGKKQ